MDSLFALSGYSAFRLATEVDEMFQLFAGRKFSLYLIQSIAHCQPRPKHYSEGLPQGTMGILGHPVAFQTNLIDAPRFCRVAVPNHIWGDVLHHLRAAANDGHRTDATELMDRRQAANNRKIFHHNMSRQSAV